MRISRRVGRLCWSWRRSDGAAARAPTARKRRSAARSWTRWGSRRSRLHLRRCPSRNRRRRSRNPQRRGRGEGQCANRRPGGTVVYPGDPPAVSGDVQGLPHRRGRCRRHSAGHDRRRGRGPPGASRGSRTFTPRRRASSCRRLRVQRCTPGAAPWPVGSGAYERVLSWIRAGRPAGSRDRGEGSRRPASRASRTSDSRRGAVARRRPRPRRPASVAAGCRSDAVAGHLFARACTRPGSAPGFASAVHPILMSTCAACHRAGGPAGMTRFLLSGDPVTDEAAPARSSSRPRRSRARC